MNKDSPHDPDFTLKKGAYDDYHTVKKVDFTSYCVVWRSLILPSLSLALPIAASTIRLFRATLLSNLNKDYVLYAKARGLSMRTIMWRHVLKNSLPLLITLFSQYLGYMVVGSAVVESIFSWQGIGTHLVNAIIARDLPTVNGCVLVIAIIFVTCNIFADIINLALNPRLKFGGNSTT